MMLTLLVLAGVAVWVCMSPVRVAVTVSAAGAVGCATHPAIVLTVTAVVVALAAVVTGRMVWAGSAAAGPYVEAGS